MDEDAKDVAELLGLRLFRSSHAGDVSGIGTTIHEIDKLGQHCYHRASTTIHLPGRVLLDALPFGKCIAYLR
ncbi:hypothetical protein [Nocardia sp. NBC_01388]|uniref:hypothetical protein n=1 Tax=Nocardia sp. NBC_01388 TaxID=2903596 RepID=UPI003245D919